MMFGKLVRNCQASIRFCFRDSVNSGFRTSTAFGSNIIRRFSVFTDPPDPPETCVMMGRNGLMVYPGSRWVDLNTYLDSKPILDRVPEDRLFGRPEPSQPFMTNDSSCLLIKSGLYLPYFCNIHGRSYSGAFTRENVGVIGDLGRLAFRKLEQDVGNKWKLNLSAGYNEYSVFMKGIISERHPSSLNRLPQGLNDFFLTLDGLAVEGEFVLDHPCLLSDVKYGSMLIEVSRLLRNEFRVFGKSKKAIDILRRIYSADRDSVLKCQRHPILNEYLPENLKNPQFNLDHEAGTYLGSLGAVSSGGAESIVGLASSSIKSGIAGPGTPVLLPMVISTDLMLATAIILVDVNRHGSIHSVEYKLVRLIDFLPGPCANSLRKTKYTRKEVIQLLRYKFPMYLPVAFQAFWAENEWATLDARLIDPIPSLYSAPGDLDLPYVIVLHRHC